MSIWSELLTANTLTRDLLNGGNDYHIQVFIIARKTTP